MKIKLLILCIGIGISYIQLLPGQVIVLGENFDNRTIDQNDSIIVISTLGSAFASYSSQDNILVTSEPIFPFQINTGTKNIPHIEGLKLFPNPVPDKLMIQRATWDEDYIVEIFQTTGQLIRKAKWEKGAETLEMSFASLASAIYFVTISNQDLTQSSTYKINKK